MTFEADIYSHLAKDIYSTYPNWTNDTDVASLFPKYKWPRLYQEIKQLLPEIDRKLKRGNNLINIQPKPNLLFNAFNKLLEDDLKVVIIGQDPYTNIEDDVPQAMGLSFSVATGMTIPS